MASSEKEDIGKTRSKYVWDPQKLAWVEVKEELAEEEVAGEEEIEEEAVAAEAVPLGAVPAVEAPPYRGAWIRLLGFDIDLIVIAIIYFIISRALNAQISAGELDSTRSTQVLAITIGLAFVYFLGFWGWRGQTIGKMIIRGRIVRMDGSPVGFVRAFLRALVFIGYFLVASFGAVRVSNLLAIFVFLVVFLLIAFSRKKRGIHDLIAGTCVVNSRIQWPQPEVFESTDTPEAAETSETPGPELDKQG